MEEKNDDTPTQWLDQLHASVGWGIALANLSNCLDVAAGLTAVARLSYQKGFDDGTMLRKFCDDTPLAPYFPTADTRPMAERLGWQDPSPASASATESTP